MFLYLLLQCCSAAMVHVHVYLMLPFLSICPSNLSTFYTSSRGSPVSTYPRDPPLSPARPILGCRHSLRMVHISITYACAISSPPTDWYWRRLGSPGHSTLEGSCRRSRSPARPGRLYAGGATWTSDDRYVFPLLSSSHWLARPKLAKIPLWAPFSHLLCFSLRYFTRPGPAALRFANICTQSRGPIVHARTTQQQLAQDP